MKPGATSKILTESLQETVRKLTQKDLLVLGCGTNDLEFDKFDSIFQNVKKFLSIVSHTNSLLLGIPFRYDLDNSLEVNYKIHQINKKLQKLTGVFPNTSFLETANDSGLFTKHGLHRSKLGKKLTYTKITSCILTVFQSRILSPLPLKWHGLADTELHSGSSQSATSIRISNHLKKKPATRSDAFLW